MMKLEEWKKRIAGLDVKFSMLFSELALMFLFFLVITPLGFYRRLWSRKMKSPQTYWVLREKAPEDMRRLF